MNIQSKISPSQVLLYSTQTSDPILFGRDAIFERNDRFDPVQNDDAKNQKELAQLLKEIEQSGYEAEDAQQLQDLSQFMYDPWGRVRGKSHIALALTAANTEAELIHRNPKANPKAKALANIKVANAMLAEDSNEVSNAEAFEILESSIKAIGSNKFSDVNALIGKSPVYIHGLYNLGSYHMNNPVYQNTVRFFLNDYYIESEYEMDIKECSFEGLNWSAIRSEKNRQSDATAIAQGIQYLNQAIELSKNIDPKQKISTAEYLSAKGEAYHLLNHLIRSGGHVNMPKSPFKRAKHSIEQKISTIPNHFFVLDMQAANEKSLNAFNQAFKLIKSVKKHATPRHILLAEKLGGIKAPHLCSQAHLSNEQNKRFTKEAKQYIQKLREKGIHRPAETSEELLSPTLSFRLFFV